MTRLSPRLYITAPADLADRVRALAEERRASVSATWRELAELGLVGAGRERDLARRVVQELERAGLASPAVLQAVERASHASTRAPSPDPTPTE